MQVALFFIIMFVSALVTGVGLGLVNAPWWLVVAVLTTMFTLYIFGSCGSRRHNALRG